jgi:hypothetical protein
MEKKFLAHAQSTKYICCYFDIRLCIYSGLQAYGGMRDVKSMITETSLLDAQEVCSLNNALLVSLSK